MAPKKLTAQPNWPQPPEEISTCRPSEWSTEACRAYLRSGPSGHAYVRLAAGLYRPTVATIDQAWEIAAPIAIRVLTAELLSSDHVPSATVQSRDALCDWLYFRGRESGTTFDLVAAFSEADIVRWITGRESLARFGPATRKMMENKVLRYRLLYPDLFPHLRKRTPRPPEKSALPTSDADFGAAWMNARSFRTTRTQDDVEACLLLGRAVGADAGDMRAIRGDDVYRVPGAGLWVDMPGPAQDRRKRIRQGRVPVPVLARFAGRLEELAQGRGSQFLIERRDDTTSEERPSALCGFINRRLVQLGYQIAPISASSLRRAWIAEQLRANVPINTLLLGTRLSTLATAEQLAPVYGVPIPSDPAELATVLGGGDWEH